MHQFLYKIMLLVFSIFSINISQAQTVSCVNIKEVDKNIKDCLKIYNSSEILIAFDIDLTLTIPTHKAVQIPNIIKNQHSFKKITENLTSIQQDLMITLATKLIAQKLIEPDSCTILQSLQESGIKIIAFSAALTGSLANIKRLEEWRYITLKNLGIDFSNSFPHIDNTIFKNIPPYLGNYPVFYKGILSANGRTKNSSKGDVLVSFLEKSKLIPKMIILVDDTKQNIDDVEDSLKLYNSQINFLGLEYLAGKFYTDGEISEEDFINFWTNCANKAQDISSLKENE